MKQFDLYFIENKTTNQKLYTTLAECMKLKKLWGADAGYIFGVTVNENGLDFEILK